MVIHGDAELGVVVVPLVVEVVTTEAMAIMEEDIIIEVEITLIAEDNVTTRLDVYMTRETHPTPRVHIWGTRTIRAEISEIFKVHQLRNF